MKPKDYFILTEEVTINQNHEDSLSDNDYEEGDIEGEDINNEFLQKIKYEEELDRYYNTYSFPKLKLKKNKEITETTELARFESYNTHEPTHVGAPKDKENPNENPKDDKAKENQENDFEAEIAQIAEFDDLSKIDENKQKSLQAERELSKITNIKRSKSKKKKTTKKQSNSNFGPNDKNEDENISYNSYGSKDLEFNEYDENVN